MVGEGWTEDVLWPSRHASWMAYLDLGSSDMVARYLFIDCVLGQSKCNVEKVLSSGGGGSGGIYAGVG